MAHGDPGRAGLSAPRSVTEDPRLGPGSVTLLLQPMVEMIARENRRSPVPATPVNVSLSTNFFPGTFSSVNLKGLHAD